MSLPRSHTVRRLLFHAFVVAGSLAAFSAAKAESIDRETLLQQAPATCLPAAAAHYRVDEEAVTVNEKGRIKYKSSMRGVTVPIKVTINGRLQDRVCLAMKNGKFKFFANAL